MLMHPDHDEFNADNLPELTAEEEVYDWMKRTPVSAAKRPDWLAEGEEWAPRLPKKARVRTSPPPEAPDWMRPSLVGLGVLATSAAAAWFVFG